MKRYWPFGLALLLLLDGIVLFWWLRRKPEQRFDSYILTAARRYEVEPSLIKAVIWQESRFDPQARGRAGEIGLMQIRSLAAKEWAQAERAPELTAENLAHPSTNIHIGAWYLAKLLRRYSKTDNSIPYALADYNAGRTHVLRWSQGAGLTNSAVFLQQMDFPGTQRYVAAVLERQKHYRFSLAEPYQKLGKR